MTSGLWALEIGLWGEVMAHFKERSLHQGWPDIRPLGTPIGRAASLSPSAI